MQAESTNEALIDWVNKTPVPKSHVELDDLVDGVLLMEVLNHFLPSQYSKPDAERGSVEATLGTEQRLELLTTSLNSIVCGRLPHMMKEKLRTCHAGHCDQQRILIECLLEVTLLACIWGPNAKEAVNAVMRLPEQTQIVIMGLIQHHQEANAQTHVDAGDGQLEDDSEVGMHVDHHISCFGSFERRPTSGHMRSRLTSDAGATDIETLYDSVSRLAKDEKKMQTMFEDAEYRHYEIQEQTEKARHQVCEEEVLLADSKHELYQFREEEYSKDKVDYVKELSAEVHELVKHRTQIPELEHAAEEKLEDFAMEFRMYEASSYELEESIAAQKRKAVIQSIKGHSLRDKDEAHELKEELTANSEILASTVEHQEEEGEVAQHIWALLSTEEAAVEFDMAELGYWRSMVQYEDKVESDAAGMLDFRKMELQSAMAAKEGGFTATEAADDDGGGRVKRTGVTNNAARQGLRIELNEAKERHEQVQEEHNLELSELATWQAKVRRIEAVNSSTELSRGGLNAGENQKRLEGLEQFNQNESLQVNILQEELKSEQGGVASIERELREAKQENAVSQDKAAIPGDWVKLKANCEALRRQLQETEQRRIKLQEKLANASENLAFVKQRMADATAAAGPRRQRRCRAQPLARQQEEVDGDVVAAAGSSITIVKDAPGDGEEGVCGTAAQSRELASNTANAIEAEKGVAASSAGMGECVEEQPRSSDVGVVPTTCMGEHAEDADAVQATAEHSSDGDPLEEWQLSAELDAVKAQVTAARERLQLQREDVARRVADLETVKAEGATKAKAAEAARAEAQRYAAQRNAAERQRTEEAVGQTSEAPQEGAAKSEEVLRLRAELNKLMGEVEETIEKQAREESEIMEQEKTDGEEQKGGDQSAKPRRRHQLNLNGVVAESDPSPGASSLPSPRQSNQGSPVPTPREGAGESSAPKKKRGRAQEKKDAALESKQALSILDAAQRVGDCQQTLALRERQLQILKAQFEQRRSVFRQELRKLTLALHEIGLRYHQLASKHRLLEEEVEDMEMEMDNGGE